MDQRPISTSTFTAWCWTACTYRIAFDPRAGQKVLTLQGAMPRDADLTATEQHAAVRCGAGDRQALEQLCRYITRPALANERVQSNAAGHAVFKLKSSLARRNHAPGDVAA
ncbi:MAG: transposase [Burkholderiaceae bacterium]